MAQRFIRADRDQVFLMPPCVRDWLPVDHLAWLVLDAVEEFDLAAFYGVYRADGHGRPAFDPGLMVALVLYAYCVDVRSSRKIERRCHDDIAFRVLAGNLAPDHATLARFIVRHQDALAGLFGQVLALCARAGLGRAGVLAVDSTKIHADASSRQSLGYERIARELIAEGIAIDQAEDERYGERRGDELPPELADPKSRRERLKQAKRELEAEREAERAAHQQMLARRAAYERETGRRPGGRRPKPRDLAGPPSGQVNLTDPESRPMRTLRGFIQGYNAHAVATEDQLIVAARVINRSGDGGMLEPMLTQAREQMTAAAITETPELVLADAGYWSTQQIQTLSDDGLTVLIPPDGHARTGPPRRNTHGTLAARMREALRDPETRARYQLRQQIIEPVFGDTKHNRGFLRFRRRGQAAADAEWQLINATRNLRTLWRASTARAST